MDEIITDMKDCHASLSMTTLSLRVCYEAIYHEDEYGRLPRGVYPELVERAHNDDSE